MRRSHLAGTAVLAALVLGLGLTPSGADTFTVATYNLENYRLAPTAGRPAKSAAARAKIHQTLAALRPDVLAVQEIGDADVLLALRAALEGLGLSYPYWEHVSGFDTNLHVAVLSRFPIVARRPHTRLGFLLYGRRFRTSRGFAEVDIRVHEDYRLTLIAAHLKSRREIAVADQSELREQEARLLRQIVDERLEASPEVNLIVLGDFNDHPDSITLKTLIGRRGPTALVDPRPVERNGDDQPHPDPRYPPRRVTWTYYYGKEETYGRVDYVLLSPGIAREWDSSGTYVPAFPNWGTASDHRPVVAGFFARDR